MSKKSGYRQNKIHRMIKREHSVIYADDLLVVSESSNGLQHCITRVHLYCEEWGPNINYLKSKVMVFYKGGHLTKDKFKSDKREMESVKQYK